MEVNVSLCVGNNASAGGCDPSTSAGAGANGTHDSNDTDEPIIENIWVQSLFCILYTIIFVLGLFGNVLVCYVVGRNRAMQTVTNFFITNLALSDILLCCLAVPFTPLYSFVGEWLFGRVLCHLVAYSQGTSVYISTLTLMSIAIDRYCVIIYPFQPRMKLSTCFAIIAGIWAFSLLVTLPYGIFMSFYHSDNRYLCEENWPSEQYRQIYGGLMTFKQFVVPFFIIAFCYIKVSLKLNDRARAKPGQRNTRKEELDRERKRRTNRMLIAMVGIFGVSWLPLNLINLINDLHSSIHTWNYYNLCFFLSHMVAMSSTCYNPFLYAWLNENFRKEFKQVLPCFDIGSRGGPGGTRGWRSERTCNGGGETMQESLLPTSGSVRRTAPLTSTAVTTNAATANTTAQPTTDNTTTNELVEISNPPTPPADTVLAPTATYTIETDAVRLQLRNDKTENA